MAAGLPPAADGTRRADRLATRLDLGSVQHGDGLMSALMRRLLAAPTAVLLVASNLVPLAGVAFGGWRLGSVMVLYWLENGIVGIVTVARLLLVTFGPQPD